MSTEKVLSTPQLRCTRARGKARLRIIWVLICLYWVQSSACARELPKNSDKGDILLAGVVLTPGEGDGTGLAPLPGALVTIEGTKYETSTDSRGLFIFTEAPEGQVTVVISKAGFETVRRKATVEKGVEEAPTLRVEMLPLGSSVQNGILSGSGTLYATFVPRTETSSGGDGDFTNLLAILALGIDPLEVAVVRPPTDQFDPKAAMESFPITEAACHVMVRPPDSPSRTSFLEMGSVPVWPCFDAAGRYLYVSTVFQHRIEIFDTSKANEYVANVPLQNAFISSLTLSPDGRHIYATQMAKEMGVMMIDTTTHLPTGFLPLPDRFSIPNALACGSDGKLYITLTNALNPGAAGQLVTLNPSSGVVESTVAVGSTPTDVLLTPDGKIAVTVNQGSGNLSVVDLARGQVLRTLPAEVSPTKAVLSLDATKVLVTNKGSGTVSILSLGEGKILGRVKVGKGPIDIALSSDGRQAFVSNYQDGTISVLNVSTGTVEATTPPNPRSNPMGLVVRP